MGTVISVSYGNTLRGRLYDYKTNKNYRTGDRLVVPVVHAISKKRYNTLGVVRITTKIGSVKYKNRIEKLHSRKKTYDLTAVSERNRNTTKRPVKISTLPGYVRGSRNWTRDNKFMIVSREE